MTNPPIDPIREEIVMSLVTFIGPKPNLLGVDETNPPWRLEASQPVLNLEEMAQLKDIEKLTKGHFKSKVIDITYPKDAPGDAEKRMQAALQSVCESANQAIHDGFNIIILSDRNANQDRVAIPALLASSATHEFLVHQ